MSVNVAQMMVTVGANTAMAEQGIMGLARMLGPTGLLSIGAVGAGLAVAGIGAAAIHMAGDFQTGMTSIVTGAGESQSNLKLISDGVLQMARDTGASTQQLTAGLYMIESGGYHGAAGLAILQAAAEGAKVGQADLGVVADATDTVLKNFGDTGLTATQAVNTLITTVANGKTHMQDLADALSHILPTGAAAHVGLADVMGAMATMTGEGVDAANAATYLRQMIIALMAPSHASEQALAKVGLTTAQVAAEMHKSLPGAVAMITEAIGKKFPEGSAGYMQAIRDISGGSRQMQGMLLLSGQHMKTFNADVTKIGAAASGSSTQIAGWNLVQGTFNQSMSKLGEIFQTVMITLGTQLLPVATQFANLLATDLGPVVDALTGKNKLLTTGMGGELLTAAKNLGGFFEQTVVPIIKTFATVLEKNVLPAILPVVKTILEKWLPPLERIMKDILPVLNPLLQALGWLFQNAIGPGLDMAAQAIGKKFPEGSAGYMQAIRDISGGSRQMQGMLLLSGQHMKTFNADVTKIGAAASGSSTQIAGWNLVQGTFNQSMSKLGEIFQTVMITLGTQLLPVATQFANLLATDLGPVVDALTGKNKLLTTGMGGELLTAAKNLGGFFEQTVVPIIKTFATVLEKNVLPAILPVVKTILEKWLPPLERIMKDILPVLNPLLQALGWLFQNAIGPGLDMAAQAIGGMLNNIANLLDGIGKFVHNPSVTSLVGIMKDLANLGSSGINLMTGGIFSKALPHFASGGMMDTSGLALVGEAGPELVALPGGAQITPLGQLAGGAGLAPGGGYGAGGGGTTVVNLQVEAQLTADGRRIAQVVVPHIHTIIRNATGQRGM